MKVGEAIEGTVNSFNLLKFLIAPRSREEEARCNVYIRWSSSDRSLNWTREGEQLRKASRVSCPTDVERLTRVRLTCVSKGYALLLDLLRQLPVNLPNTRRSLAFFLPFFFFFSKRNFPRDFLRLSRTKRVHRRRDAIFTHSKDFFFFFCPLMRRVASRTYVRDKKISLRSYKGTIVKRWTFESTSSSRYRNVLWRDVSWMEKKKKKLVLAEILR